MSFSGDARPVSPTVPTSAVWSLSTEGLSRPVRDQIRAALTTGEDLRAAPDLPWAAVANRADGSIAAACSTTFAAGMFWTLDEGEPARLTFGVDLGEVIRSRRGSTTLDPEWVAGYASLRAPPEATPYLQVRRLRSGTTAVWRTVGAVPEIGQWCGPSVWDEPTLAGPEAMQLFSRAFDCAVDRLVVPGEPLSATLSGGLDSSLVVASLVRHATTNNPVHAFCHSPHPGAVPRRVAGWDTRDRRFAAELAASSGGRVVLHDVVAADGDSPLDAALAAAERTWWPTLNPANQLWMAVISERAARLGSSRVFYGTHGNAAFSYEHAYAVQQRWRSVAHTLVGPVRRRLDRPPAPLLLAAVRPPPPATRAFYLEWLAGNTSLPAALMPSGWDSVPVDPFLSTAVLDVAAAITPTEWRSGSMNRSFARRISAGRVPESIRLRATRGAQGADNWFLVRAERQRYLEEARALTQTPVLDHLVDHGELLAQLMSWPWGEPLGPSKSEVLAVERILSLGAFVRLTSERLRALPISAGPGALPGTPPPAL